MSVAPEAAADAESAGLSCRPESFGELTDVRLISITVESSPAPHCMVIGFIGAEIGFELRLPDAWNGKFIMGGSGGFGGNFANAAHDFWNVVPNGWATVSTDTGHKGNPADASWALNNPERQVNFGHLAVHRTAVNSKALIEGYYGSEIKRSLFFGCSRGGGQGLMVAQRSPELFDGVYAGAPALSWTTEMAGRWTWNAQRMYPDMTELTEPVIDAAALSLIGNAVLEQCDALDGLMDGVLNDPRRCRFDVASLACDTGSSDPCLTPEQVAVAQAIYGDLEIGGKMSRGAPLGSEIPGTQLGWDRWITGGYDPDDPLDFHPGADAEGFADPVTPNARWAFATGLMRYFVFNDPFWSYEGYNFSDFAQKSAPVAQILDADNPDLSAFRSRGGKLIIDNGWMDGSLSAHGTIDYYDSVIDFDPTARDDVRLFVRPGVAHCKGGPGPDGTNYIAALEEWLDSGVPPEKLDAPYVSPAPGRPPTGQGGRIICAHPSVVTYDGSGDPNNPASFSCAVPHADTKIG
ncbi:MAG: tannase/feruloyl esterase family alpha/beta hydrolase [Actinomycetia bacterium]|nr:tannase/feruloyl esterase family alpha/beta hydrolase [Actinomycetes bacterium]